MHSTLFSAWTFILTSTTLFLCLTNAYMEIPCLETYATRHGNITIDCTFNPLPIQPFTPPIPAPIN